MVPPSRRKPSRQAWGPRAVLTTTTVTVGRRRRSVADPRRVSDARSGSTSKDAAVRQDLTRAASARDPASPGGVGRTSAPDRTSLEARAPAPDRASYRYSWREPTPRDRVPNAAVLRGESFVVARATGRDESGTDFPELPPKRRLVRVHVWCAPPPRGESLILGCSPIVAPSGGRLSRRCSRRFFGTQA